MPEAETTAQENTPAEGQDKFIIKDVFPIETARKNVSNYLKALHTRKFVNKIVSSINYGIRSHSEQGESDAQIVFSLLEVFGDYPISKEDQLFHEVLDVTAQQFIDGGYTVSKKQIATDWGVKGFVFTISWNEQEGTEEETEGTDGD